MKYLLVVFLVGFGVNVVLTGTNHEEIFETMGIKRTVEKCCRAANMTTDDCYKAMDDVKKDSDMCLSYCIKKRLEMVDHSCNLHWDIQQYLPNDTKTEIMKCFEGTKLPCQKCAEAQRCLDKLKKPNAKS